ncbi:MAG: ABC transporter permease [Planctomycetota bacterium]|nr:ABC transporter permease [Planctomycetota bacterium]
MEFLWEGIQEAFRLVVGGDQQVFHAVGVTLYCTVTAVTLAALVAIPYGAWLGLYRPRGYRLQVFVLRVGMFVPTVVVGLIVFGMLSRQGPLGWLDSLYTKQAIVAGEFLLAFPILGTFTHAAVRAQRGTPLETALTLGAGRQRAMLTMLGEVRVPIVAAILAAFARCFSELGVAIPVGGNLELRTRTLASTIVLDLSKGNFAKAVAPGLILIALACVIATIAFLLERERES